MQDLYSTDQPQPTYLDQAGYTAPTRQHELDHTDQVPIYLPCLADLDHDAGTDHTDHLSELWKIVRPCYMLL